MSEKSAKGVVGYILYSPWEDHFFRIYGEKDENGRKSFVDYAIFCNCLRATIVGNYLSLYESIDGMKSNLLDFNCKVLNKSRADMVERPAGDVSGTFYTNPATGSRWFRIYDDLDKKIFKDYNFCEEVQIRIDSYASLVETPDENRLDWPSGKHEDKNI